jgi:peptide/nickel transport system substrate-binding protein
LSARVGRRSLGTAAAAAVALAALPSWGMPRLPTGGRVAFRIPWPVGTVDPHRLDDATAALFGDALFDTLYVLGEGGTAVASLAETEPQVDAAAVVVVMREGLKSAGGHAIAAREAALSIARARTLGALAWLAELPVPKVTDARTLRFATKDAALVARTLSSPLTAILPAGFSPERPDGTGPFRAQRSQDGLTLVRNPLAARGPSFLDEVVIHAAPDLAESLRAFEGGSDDIGWLGSGLHEPRPGSRPFDAGMVAWAVLRTGRDAAQWDAPGVAQRFCDSISPARLGYLALGAAWPTDPMDGWSGPPCELVVRDDSPWLIELARALAAILTRPAHEVTARVVPPSDFAQRRSTRAYALALDVVRPFAPGTLAALAALATADNPALAGDIVKHPPRIGEAPPRTLTRTMRLGVVGEVRVQGGRSSEVTLVASPNGGLDLGASLRARRGT